MEIVKISDDIIKINNDLYKIVESDKLFDCCFNCELHKECINNNFLNHTICTEIQRKTNIKAYKKYFVKLIENMEDSEPKEIKITPPEGYEIDKENSTFDCIKFKKVLKWRDYKLAKFGGYFINTFDSSIRRITNMLNHEDNFNVFATEKQAKSAIAMARISQIMANDERFGGVITDKEWKDDYIKYVINRCNNNIDVHTYCTFYHFLAFHTEEQRTLFLKENEDLVKDYLMID